MRDALNSFLHEPHAQQESSRGVDSVMLRGTYLRDAILTRFPSKHNASQEVNSPLVQQHHSTVGTPSEASLEQKSPDGSAMRGIFADDMRIRSWCARYSHPNPIIMDGDPPLFGLNDTQRSAIAMMLSERISLVQGPPGTGKTRTIIEAIRLLKVRCS